MEWKMRNNSLRPAGLAAICMFFLAILSVSAQAQKPCGWAQEETLVIPGTLSDKQENALDKLLDKLEDAAGGAIPEIGAVKKAIKDLGPGKDVVGVVIVYKCTDNEGTVHRQRRSLDNTENVLWAAKMDQAKGDGARERDRQRQTAINKHRPTTSCCPPANTGTGEPPKPTPGKEPCKPPPPCKECNQLYVAIVAACERIEEIADEQDNLGTQLRAAEGEGDRKKVNDIKADSARRRAEQARLEARIKDLKAKLKSCEKEHCGKKATDPPAGGLDKCLIGKWRSQSTMSGPFFRMWGGGVLLDIKPNGSILVDYDGMEPKVDVDALGRIVMSQTWRGKASGTIGTTAGNVNVKNVANTALTREVTSNGQSSTNRIGGLGIVFASPIKKVNYTCSDKALTLQPIFVEGFVLETYTFTKSN
jgi:hypothetical protein